MVSREFFGFKWITCARKPNRVKLDLNDICSGQRKRVFRNRYEDDDIVVDGNGLQYSSPAGSAKNAPGNDDDVLSMASTGIQDPFDCSELGNFDLKFSLRDVGDGRGRALSEGIFSRNVNWSHSSAVFDEIVKVQPIGRGCGGEVWKCINKFKSKGAPVALKEIPTGCNEERMQLIAHEAKVNYKTAHPMIVKCHAVRYIDNCFHLLMEYMDAGSLLDLLKAANGRRIPELALSHVSKCMLQAIGYLHDELRVIHRDIKPGNILLSREGCVKLGDLGVSASLDSSPMLSQWVGTVTYMSPERMTGESYSLQSDIWSVGLVIAECALSHYPYTIEVEDNGAMVRKTKDLQFWDLLDLVISGQSPAEKIAKISENTKLVDFVSMCMERDPDLRPSARKLLTHSFLQRENCMTGKSLLVKWIGSVKPQDN
eukprot:761032-Hanusia_phi.AAC.14